MKKWKDVAVQRAGRTPNRYFTGFQHKLRSWLRIHPNAIRGYFWAMRYTERDLPKVDMIILMHRRSTDSACMRTALEEAFDGVADVSIVATTDRRAFRNIVALRVL
jgi:hypothetical protein